MGWEAGRASAVQFDETNTAIIHRCVLGIEERSPVQQSVAFLANSRLFAVHVSATRARDLVLQLIQLFIRILWLLFGRRHDFLEQLQTLHILISNSTAQTRSERQHFQRISFNSTGKPDCRNLHAMAPEEISKPSQKTNQRAAS